MSDQVWKHVAIPMDLRFSGYFDKDTGRLSVGCVPAVELVCKIYGKDCWLRLDDQRSAFFVLALLREIEAKAEEMK